MLVNKLLVVEKVLVNKILLTRTFSATILGNGYGYSYSPVSYTPVHE